MNLQPGDILASYGRCAESWALRACMLGGPSHLSMVVRVRYEDLIGPPRVDRRWAMSGPRLSVWRDRLLIVESTTPFRGDPSCAITGRRFRGVQAHELSDVEHYPGAVYRVPLLAALDPVESMTLATEALDRIGVEYDGPGAILAGLRCARRLCWRRAADKQAYVCVELVGALVQAALLSRRLPDFNAGALMPWELVTLLQDEGIYGPEEAIK